MARPKLRGTTEAFASRLFGTGITKSNALESLVIAGFVRGLPICDVKATLADALGAEAALSTSTVSTVCQAICDELAAWSARRLDDIALDYLFVDASMFKMHASSCAERVLAAWGITSDGKPVFVGLDAGGAESTDAWAEFLDGLKKRGLRDPLLIISDGAAGLIHAIEATFPQRIFHKTYPKDTEWRSLTLSTHMHTQLREWGVLTIFGQGLSTERICSCQSDAGGSARSSRLRPCSW